MKQKFGTHVSIADGLAATIDIGEALGCDTMQIFTKSNRQWHAKPLKAADVDAFIDRKAASTIDPIFVHTSYLINLAANDAAIRRRSLAGLVDELKRAEKLQLPFVVLHPGSHVGAGEEKGLPEGSIQIVSTTDRRAIQALIKCDEFIDLIIPRGGRGLIEMIMSNSRIPVIKHLDGNCYIYVDETADPSEAVRIIVNAKTQRVGVCNSLESMLIHEKAAPELLKTLIPTLQDKGVEIRADEAVRNLSDAKLAAATEEDWRTEYLDLILTMGTAPSLDAAIEFINANSSHHTDAILTRDHNNAMRFLAAVDSACVFVNASTRFSDGGEFGLGCEIGISTDKLHVRGPVGLRDLTSMKYIAFGNGQIRT